jgi:hypothetical protein
VRKEGHLAWVLVVKASVRPAALITAGDASDQGRDLFAVLGRQPHVSRLPLADSRRREARRIGRWSTS